MSGKIAIRHKRVWPMVMLSLLFAFHLSLFTACSGNPDTFLLEGTFKGFNQGELYIYGYDGSRQLDTVAVVKGQFRYEIPLEDSTTFILVFPNFSELAIFGRKGATVKLEGDATHLRETKIKGLKENEEMTAFRLQTSQQTPPEMAKSVAEFISGHPTSPFAPYLMKKYFLQTAQPDYQKAVEAAMTIHKANPAIPGMGDLIRRMKGVQALKDGGKLPAFTATDIKGQTVKSSDLNAKVNVISVWASWNYESIGVQRKLTTAKNKHKDDLKVLSICLDADVKVCRRKVERDSVKWSTICDGKVWETPVLSVLGLSYVPDNIITDSQGKIIAHSLSSSELPKKLDKLLPD